MIHNPTGPAHEALTALRADLPSEVVDERMRARLAAVGVAVGGAVATSVLTSNALAAVPGAATPAAVASKSLAGSAGLLAKLAGVPVVIKAASVALVIAGAASVPILTREAPREPERPAPGVVHTPVQGVAPEAVPKQVPAPIDDAVESASVPAEPRRVLRARPRPVDPAVTAEPSAPASALRRESTLLHEALVLLRAGDAARARTLIDQHEQLFGAESALALERERLRREISASTR